MPSRMQLEPPAEDYARELEAIGESDFPRPLSRVNLHLAWHCPPFGGGTSAAWDGLVFEHPKTSRSRRSVALPAFIRPHLERQRHSQLQRRAESADWQEHDLVVDRGDGGRFSPDTLSSAWHRF
jgi:hypothetical protein